MGDTGQDSAVRDGLPPSPPIFVPESVSRPESGRPTWLAAAAILELVCVVALVPLYFDSYFGLGQGVEWSWKAWQLRPLFLATAIAALALPPATLLLLLPRRPARAYRPVIAGLAVAGLVVGYGLAVHERELRAHVGPVMLSVADRLEVPPGLEPVGRPSLHATVDDLDATTVPQVTALWRPQPGAATACDRLLATYRARPGWQVLTGPCAVYRTSGRMTVYLWSATAAEVAVQVPGAPHEAGIVVQLQPADH